MASGCPVTCSNTSSIPEIVGSAAIFFDPHSVESIRGAMETIVTDQSARNQLVAEGYKRAEFFSWKKCAEETYAVYKALL
jgi:glycosyltransferase involved in cell wall biosynthesis